MFNSDLAELPNKIFCNSIGYFKNIKKENFYHDKLCHTKQLSCHF